MKALLALAFLAVAVAALAEEPAEPPVRQPAVAGSFYEADPVRLQAGIDAMLADAPLLARGRPVALLAPHAGYIYSGQVAADAWRQVRDLEIDVVVVLGANHTAPAFRGASIYHGSAYRTPLGDCPVDRELGHQLVASYGDLFQYDPAYHRTEHSVEVQIPFIQTVLPNARILPIVVAAQRATVCQKIGEALAEVLAGRRVIVVASSDLSHYPDAAGAEVADTEVLAAAARLIPDQFSLTIDRTMQKGLPGLETCACGKGAMLVMMHAARGLGANFATVLEYAHSGQTVLGDPGRVVGYGAMIASDRARPGSDTTVLSPVALSEAKPLSPDQQRVLLAHARRTIVQYLTTGTAPLARQTDPRLHVHQGAFVTIEDKADNLRGCIGHLQTTRPLGEVVGAMAIQAATNDGRFSPVKPGDMQNLILEISVLTPPRRVAGPENVRVGTDGVIIQKGNRQAVFLPQVATQQGWDRDTMLTMLSRKAGLDGNAWQRPGCTFLTFQAQVFREE